MDIEYREILMAALFFCQHAKVLLAQMLLSTGRWTTSCGIHSTEAFRETHFRQPVVK